MKITVFSSDGKTSSQRDFDRLPVFEGDKGRQAAKEVIVAINANNRQGTHSTKMRSEVRGGGRKPWRQKGTGRARAGSIRSPLWKGGGVVFGPKPRDYSKKVNARVKTLAFQRALFDRVTEGDVVVVEEFAAPEGRTKAMSTFLSLVAPKGSVLLVDSDFGESTARAARNIARVSMQEAARLNVLDLARHRTILLSARALESVITRVGGAKS
jgi:large subunit ribosomal protein L4